MVYFLSNLSILYDKVFPPPFIIHIHTHIRPPLYNTNWRVIGVLQPFQNFRQHNICSTIIWMIRLFFFFVRIAKINKTRKINTKSIALTFNCVVRNYVVSYGVLLFLERFRKIRSNKCTEFVDILKSALFLITDDVRRITPHYLQIESAAHIGGSSVSDYQTHVSSNEINVSHSIWRQLNIPGFW